MSPWSIPYLHESKPPTILHSQRWRFWFPIESRALTQKDLTKATEILRDRTNYIDSTCTHIYTYIYTYVYRWVLYSSFIVQHSKSQLKHIILFKFHMYVFSKINADSWSSHPPNSPPFTHLRLGDWRRQPWRILWEKPVMDTSIHTFGYWYGCRYHFFIWCFMDVIMVMLFWLKIIGPFHSPAINSSSFPPRRCIRQMLWKMEEIRDTNLCDSRIKYQPQLVHLLNF